MFMKPKLRASNKTSSAGTWCDIRHKVIFFLFFKVNLPARYNRANTVFPAIMATGCLRVRRYRSIIDTSSKHFTKEMQIHMQMHVHTSRGCCDRSGASPVSAASTSCKRQSSLGKRSEVTAPVGLDTFLCRFSSSQIMS